MSQGGAKCRGTISGGRVDVGSMRVRVGCIPRSAFGVNANRTIVRCTKRDVSYSYFDVHQDDSYTGRRRVERHRRELRLRDYSRVAVEQTSED